MTVSLSASLPTGDYNGLGALACHLVADPPGTMHVIVALVDCAQITTKVDSGATVPTARIRAIEGFRGTSDDAQDLRKLWRRAYELRTGQAELPLELDRLDDHDGGEQ